MYLHHLSQNLGDKKSHKEWEVCFQDTWYVREPKQKARMEPS